MSSVLSQAAGGASAPMARKLGRYELQTLLGKSARCMLWLARDPAGGGEPLWLTLPRQQPADEAAHARWLHRARLAARIEHPKLLAVLAVGDQERWPLVASPAPGGGTLEQRLADAAAEPPSLAQAVGWLCELLQGLAMVHDAGLAHGDIGAHCIALDPDGRVRLAGLGGCLPRLDAAGDAAQHNARAVDTGALRSQRGAAERDLLACGLLLHRLVAGRHALDEPDADRAIDRLEEREIVRLGFATPQPVPDALRAIVNRATEREPRRRFLSARSLQRALQGWLDAQAAGGEGALALLLDRLASVGHLPALPGLLARVGKVAGMEQQGLADMAEILLQDPALVFELLRHVHAAQFASAGERRVATVRRAVQLIGLQGLRRAATALRPWPGALAEPHCGAFAAAVREARLAAHMARILCPADMDGEAAYLVALLQQLGWLLARYHFADEAGQIARLVHPDAEGVPGMDETAAACAVLGVDLDSLGQAVARHWGLGETLQQAMRRHPLDAAVRPPEAREDMLRLLASAAGEAVAAAALPQPRPRGSAKPVSPFARVTQRYQRALHLGSTELADAYAEARRTVDGEPAPADAGTAKPSTERTS